MDSLNRWQDRVEMLVGIWLLMAPWILGLPLAAAWCAMVVGAFVILLSAEDFVLPDQIEEWGNAILGVGLIISPWAWGYADHRLATVNAIVSGLLVTGFAAWALERVFMHDRIRHS
ncbi:MAG: SPW repeat protein [Noviherbaspirillum sp.]